MVHKWTNKLPQKIKNNRYLEKSHTVKYLGIITEQKLNFFGIYRRYPEKF